MPSFRATNQQTNDVVEYDAAAPHGVHLTGDWRLEELIIGETPPDQQLPVDTRVYGGRRILTKLEFLRLFTQAERKGIRRIRNANEDLDDYLYLLEMAAEVDLDGADTQAGVMMLELAGILATGRAGEILNG